MEKLKKIGRFLFRIDNFNRIIVFLSMVLFIVVPCWLLYCVDETKMDFDLIMPCVLLLGMVLGNGLLTIYRPLRCSFIYFFLMIVTYVCVYKNFNYQIIPLNLNMTALYWIFLIYCIVGVTYNLFYFLFYMKRRNKNTSDEATNNDNPYDFLGGNKSNNEIVKLINEINEQENNLISVDKLKKTKLSKTARVVSSVLCIIVFFGYIIDMFRSGVSSNTQLMIICFLGIVTLIIVILASLLFPKDFKYMYYFDAFFLLVTAIIACDNANERPFALILASLVVGASFLITLIVEGRTWTGAHPD